jgi:DNA polymerase III subunit delta|tara:strand:- start:1408 stop:2409 length:1002 start_codon:yes stop_codon:yes gene_type:complete
MILKSYLVERNVEILKNYQATIIYGVNNGTKDDIKEQIKDQNKDCEIITFFENDISKKDLLYENTTNQSLFASKKIIFIQEASDKIFDEISACLQKENKEVQIYIFSENLEKKSKLRNFFEKDKKLASIACYEDNERTLLNYINRELKEFKGLTGEITNIIINNSNLDRKIIKNELIKIKTFFSEKKINKDQIIEILNIKNDGGFDDIRDKALMGEKLKVNKLLSETEILNDEAFFYLNNLSHRVMRLHEIFKGSKNNSEYDRILENLKPPIFWKDKPIIQQQLRKWNLKKIEEMLFKIAETEILMKKNSYIKNNVIIKDLIIKLTNKASTSY